MNWKEELLNAKEEVVYVKFDSYDQLQENKSRVIKTIMQKVYEEKIKNKNNQEIKLMTLGIYVDDFIDIFKDIQSYYFANSECQRLISPDNNLPSNICRIIFGGSVIYVHCLQYDNYLDDLQKYDMCILFLHYKLKTKNTKQMIYLSDKFDDVDLYTIKFTEEKLPLAKRIEHYVEKLFLELEEIPMNDKTTMTRERLITMINNLEDLRKRIIKNY